MAAAAMMIGDIVLYQGRRYVLHGFTHAGLMKQHAVIEDAATDEFVTVPLDEVEPVGAEDEPKGVMARVGRRARGLFITSRRAAGSSQR